MTKVPCIRTARLLLRPWRDADLQPFAAMNSDPRVMEFMPVTLTTDESDAFAHRIRTHFDEHCYGLWAVQTEDLPFIGFIGLQWSNFDAEFTPAVEVGFRLMAEQWGRGYATEGGKAAVEWAFSNTDLPAVHSWTACLNQRSRRVIRKVGLKYVGKFDHPCLPVGNRLRRHALYRIVGTA